MKAVTPGQNLTREEARWLEAYRAMNNEAQDLALDIAEDMAKDWPAPRKKPRLRLVANVAQTGSR